MIILFAVAALLALPQVQAEDNGNPTIRVGAMWVSPTGEFSDVTQSISFDNAVGAEVGFEFLPLKWLGVEGVVGWVKQDVTGSEVFQPEETVGDVSLIPLTANVNFHVINTKLINFYVGPSFSWMMWGDVNTSDPLESDVKIKDSFGYGVNAGIDFGIGEDFIIYGGVRYYWADAEDEQPGGAKVPVDPLMVRIGVGWKW
jgi:outer membrane protein W